MLPDLAVALAEIDSATNGMSDAELAWHPEGKWSGGDILEHLSLAFAGTVRGARRALDENRPKTHPPTIRDRLRVLVVLKLGHFPHGRRSPEVVAPRGVPPRQAFNSIRESLIAMDKAITECELRFGSRTKILTHPVLGPLTAREWCKFHRVHTLHHMRQIRGLRERIRSAAAAA